jgi:hypothetical protein
MVQHIVHLLMVPSDNDNTPSLKASAVSKGASSSTSAGRSKHIYEGDAAAAGLLPSSNAPDLEEELTTKLAELAVVRKKIKQADTMTLGKAFDPFRNIDSLLEQAPV